ncbi:MalY/PatB family protein [Serinibacter arcticus]|uniref:cysteine-S-conjugate beta-lyase n=1 Tax=Serinibacter arcticus TaxID=1655435 RepID=A0A4Z1E7B1_9MICO|nr:aminotransferase class I/II-fold pyridoxal phosphate-dependent enzyme [Serinibacter arcticus]TGO06582.1 Cystathionine beta-lyase, type II [Serinibacter arcticus]
MINAATSEQTSTVPDLDTAAVDALTAADLVARGSQKWTTFPGTIGAWVAELDLPLAPPITRALHGAVENATVGYLPVDLVRDTARACSDWYRRTSGWDFPASDVRLVPDVLTALRVTLDHVTGPGSTAVVTTPAYMPFLTRPGLVGHGLRTVAAAQDGTGRWAHDLDALDATLASIEGPALLVLCNPWNPVGRVLTAEELLAISEVVERHGATVFSDEIHAPLLLDDVAHVPYASLNETTAQHTVTAVSASKAWNLPGLKCAQMIATTPRLREILQQPATLAGYEAATIGLVANIAAYDDGGPWLAGARDYLRGNRDAFVGALASAIPDAVPTHLEGTYLQLVDLRDVRSPSGAALPDDLGAFFREHAGVAITDGALCGAPGHIRVNLGMPRPLLLEATAALGRAVLDLDAA